MEIHNPQDQHSYIFQKKPVLYATFWQRFFAMLIDCIILSLLSLIISTISSWTIKGDGLIISWLYYAIQESGNKQATLGKRAMWIIVTDTSGKRISFGKASVRYFSQILSLVILLIGYFMMLWDKRNQTLHDKIADTVVIRRFDW